ncbi:MAG: hypothetical protein D6717_14350, partial [Gammaproteobacteria bacterium]
MRWLYILSFLLLAGPLRAGLLALPAEPDFDRRWSFATEGGACVLRQDVPLVGELRFERGRDQAFRFLLRTRFPLRAGEEATLRLDPPPWQNGAHAGPAMKMRLRNGLVPLALPVDATQDLFQGVYAGQQLSIELPGREGGLYGLRMAALPVGFREAAEAFAHCVQGLASTPGLAAAVPLPGAARQAATGSRGDSALTAGEDLVDESRLLQEAPDPRLTTLRPAWSTGAEQGLAYQRPRNGRAPVRIRIP